MRLPAMLCLLFSLAALPAQAQFTATRVASGLSQPLLATAPSDDPDDDRLFIVSQGGQIRILQDGSVLGTPFLDISGLISSGGERGLLGLAFAPDYASSGFFYVNYTDEGGDTVVARYEVSANPNVADAGSAEVLFTIGQPEDYHNGGHLAFSPVDGYLYIGMGDGGVRANAQNSSNPLGAMLRIDVSDAPGYDVPPSNPGFGDSRIWANGLRNPFRFSFDRVTGDLFIGDVGENSVEEVDFQPTSSDGGENYGWSITEGSDCFDPPNGCNKVGLTLPVMEYMHGQFPDVAAVIGGYRYRGPELSLQGIYFFGDLGGLLFAATETAPGEFDFERITVTPNQGSIDVVTSFGEDAVGNVYIVDRDGEVFRIDGSIACPEAPRDDCRLAGKSKLKLVAKGDGGKLKWKWRGGDATATADFGDPVSATSQLLCVYSGDPSALEMEALVPPGSSWKAKGDKGFKYKDKDAAPDGIAKMKLKSGEIGKAKLLVAGKGSNLDVPELPFEEGAPVIVQLNNDASGVCFEDSYAGDEVKKNDAGAFKAKQ